jgi:hypothetical protein
MNNFKFKVFIGLFTLALATPSISAAYSTTNQTATKINADTILYTITYKFGFTNREMLMPFIAKNTLGTTSFSNFVEYAVETDASKIVALTSAKALVLTSDADVIVKDGQYYLPEGRSAEFTLLALLKVADVNLVKNQNLSLQIKNLPFTMIEDNKSTLVELDTPELKPYRTPAVAF